MTVVAGRFGRATTTGRRPRWVTFEDENEDDDEDDDEDEYLEVI